MRRTVLTRAVAIVIGLATAVAQATTVTLPSAEWLLDQVKILSAPEMEGRASGTAGADRAAEHISRAFKEAALRPGGDGGGYLQRFTVPTQIRLGPTNALEAPAGGQLAWALGRDFMPLAVSSDGTAEGEVVFAGYGITAPDLGYDDYAGLDARGKIVLALTREPRSEDTASPFRRPEAYHYSERSHKIINARQHGASAILLVAHPAADRDTLAPLRGTSQPLGVPAASVSRALADALLSAAGHRLAARAAAIDQSLAPRSLPLPGVRAKLTVSLVRERGTAANVVGILPGTDVRLRDEAIVVGAHYDHLGRGGEGSLAPDQIGVVHHGADDNASGTAAVMGLARALAAGGGLPRTVLFIAFAGEEIGLLGSTHYVRQPAVALDRTVFMINLDMIGRLRDGKLYVGGVDSGAALRRVVEDAARGLTLTPQLRGDPFAPSDHNPFYSAGRPVLFLFTGAHGDYHRPTDTWDKINASGLATVTTFVERVMAIVAREPTPPAYVKIEPPARGGGRGGYGPLFGVVPEFAEGDRSGVRIGGVRPGSPAERAGVQAGDVIVKFAGMVVNTLEDLTFVLRSRRVGDRIAVVIVRDGRQHELEAVLDERR